MSIKRLIISLFAVSLLGLNTATAKAQTETPSDENIPLGEVTGTIVNKSPDGVIPENVELMLHAWDQNYMGQGMYHGQTLPDGSFIFTDVDLNPTLIFAVMATYDGATYFSETKAPSSTDTLLEFEVPIYDTTAHLTEVSIDQAHVLFSFVQSGMEILEVYFISNLGEYTIQNAVTLDDGQLATLAFSLPENASNISFKDSNETRFIQFPGGFADTSPLVPGRGAGQIVLRYLTPYEDQFTYTFSPPVPVEDVQFLVVQDDGITVEGGSITLEGPQTVQDGTTFDVYSHAPLQANERVAISISGEPTNVSVPLIEASETGSFLDFTSNLELGLGALVLGLTLIAAGVWWWRKPIAENDEIDGLLDQPDFRDLVAQIVELDEAYQAGNIAEEAYQQRRKALTEDGKALLIFDEKSNL